MMIFGIPREIRSGEERVGALPYLVKELVRREHQVLVETRAGEGCQATDSQYERAGATIVPSAEKLYLQADQILKVREPMPVEFDLIRPDHNIFAFFHFINNPDLIKSLAARGCTCVAYEMMTDKRGRHPISAPIGSLTGQMAVMNGAFYLQKQYEGKGIMLGHVAGTAPARVTVLGAGNVGRQAAVTAAKLGAQVSILDTDYYRLQEINALGYSNILTLFSNDDNIRRLLPETDLLISAIQVSNIRTPRLITREMVKTMQQGAVIVDVDVDMGGSIETSKSTNLDNPTFEVDGVIHYCVSNISAGIPAIASQALSAVISPLLQEIAQSGFEEAALKDPLLHTGIGIYKGFVANEELSNVSELPLRDLTEKLEEFRAK